MARCRFWSTSEGAVEWGRPSRLDPCFPDLGLAGAAPHPRQGGSSPLSRGFLPGCPARESLGLSALSPHRSAPREVTRLPFRPLEPSTLSVALVLGTWARALCIRAPSLPQLPPSLLFLDTGPSCSGPCLWHLRPSSAASPVSAAPTPLLISRVGDMTCSRHPAPTPTPRPGLPDSTP